MYKYFAAYKFGINSFGTGNGIINMNKKINSSNLHEAEEFIEKQENYDKCVLINFILLDE